MVYFLTAKSLQLCLTLCDPIDGSPYHASLGKSAPSGLFFLLEVPSVLADTWAFATKRCLGGWKMPGGGVTQVPTEGTWCLLTPMSILAQRTNMEGGE